MDASSPPLITLYRSNSSDDSTTPIPTTPTPTRPPSPTFDPPPPPPTPTNTTERTASLGTKILNGIKYVVTSRPFKAIVIGGLLVGAFFLGGWIAAAVTVFALALAKLARMVYEGYTTPKTEEPETPRNPINRSPMVTAYDRQTTRSDDGLPEL